MSATGISVVPRVRRRSRIGAQSVDSSSQQASNHLQNKSMEVLIRKVQLLGPLSDSEKARLIEIAERCPVHKTLHNNPQVLTTLIA